MQSFCMALSLRVQRLSSTSSVMNARNCSVALLLCAAASWHLLPHASHDTPAVSTCSLGQHVGLDNAHFWSTPSDFFFPQWSHHITTDCYLLQRYLFSDLATKKCPALGLISAVTFCHTAAEQPEDEKGVINAKWSPPLGLCGWVWMYVHICVWVSFILMLSSERNSYVCESLTQVLLIPHLYKREQNSKFSKHRNCRA